MPIEEYEWSASAGAVTDLALYRSYYYEDINHLIMVETGTGNKYVPVTDDRGTLVGVINGDTNKLIEKIYYNSTGLSRSFSINPTSGAETENPDGRSLYLNFQ